MNIDESQLQQVAERLGWVRIGRTHMDWHCQYTATHAEGLGDGDLLLCLLNRAAEMPDDDGENLMAVMHGLLTAAEEQPRPDFLEAAILAFIQLPASQGDA